MAQEQSPFQEAQQYAQDLADLKKLIKTEDYVCVDIGYYDNPTATTTREWVRLYRYDLPRWLWEEKQWVIRWRIAKLQCQHPRRHVDSYLTFYDKKTGFDEQKKELLQKITNHFTQIRRVERAIAAHDEHCKTLLMITPKEEEIKKQLLAKIEWRKSELQKLIQEYETYRPTDPVAHPPLQTHQE